VPEINQLEEVRVCAPVFEEAAMLKSFLLFSAVVLIAFTPTPTLGGRPQETTPAPTSATPATNTTKITAESQAKAKSLYQIDCAMCHGDNGDGKTDLAKSMGLSIGDFTDGKLMASKTDAQLFDLIRNGKDKMPPEVAGRANDTTVWNLIHYIRLMAKSQPAAAPAQ
jgi:mono/diheme cytochrome c family protein